MEVMLLRLHLREQWPEFESVVFEIFGGVLTRAERDWIEFFADVGLPSLPSGSMKRKELKKLLKELKNYYLTQMHSKNSALKDSHTLIKMEMA